ncbi:MAG TPA: YciI family protein [Methylomirabilota bacterium]|nr:YciI family protein [Methylomirabilota bacterium]
MMFAVTCFDKPDHASVRTANRPAHLEYLKANAASIRIAGPLLTDDGGGMVGSLLLVEAPDRAAAEAVLSDDPYAKAGLFASTDIRPWRWVIGAPA